MIESGGTIQLGDDRRQLDAKPPLVGASSGADDDVAPLVPPPRDKPGERLDDEHAVARRRTIDEPLQQGAARLVVAQFVDSKRGEYRASRHVARLHIATLRP